MTDLHRFVTAQETSYAQALAELQAGLKTSHWMWFVFPQLAGLGRSSTARFFAIGDLGEAQEYLDHSLLGPRLREATSATTAWAGERTLDAIFGPVDALKFVSCMTLFEAAAEDDLKPKFADALDALAGGARDRQTLRAIIP